MAVSPTTAETAGGDSTASVVLVAEARTSTERGLIGAWAKKGRPGAELIEIGDPGLGRRLNDRGDDTLVEPLRVTWLPPHRRERRGTVPFLSRWSDLLLLFDPRRPNARLHSLIARRSPHRVRITAGDAAPAADLRRRFEAQEESATPDAFGAFVARQAQIACDRAERQLIGDRYKVPRLVAEQIAASAHFRDQVRDIAARESRDFDEALAAATDALRELVAVQSPLAIDAFRAFVRPMHARAWTVEPDRESLERLRELNRTHALVFLPTHRSYVDPLVLAEVLHDADFPRNHMLGGDNMAFWPMGPLGRRAGVIFIRRNFGGDRLYKLAVKAYFGHLVAKRFNLEWYIEGGRTRTGKLRPPRFGLLHYLAGAVADCGQDVLLVPTSIVYDRLHEVGAMAAEQKGASKRGEGLRWMADYIRAQRENVGTARVDFGEPFSLREAMEEAGEGPAQLEKVAFRICDGINRVTPVHGTSLVSLVLLGLRDRALTLHEICVLTAPLLDLLEQRGVLGDLAGLRRPETLRTGLDALVGAGAVERYDGGDEPVWSVAPEGHTIAAFYRNGVLHHLLLRGLVELGLARLAGPSADTGADVLDAAWRDALALRDLLKFEFFFPDKQRFRDELAAEIEIIDRDWAERIQTSEGAAELLASCDTLVAHRTLRSFFDAQLLVARLLARRGQNVTIDREALLHDCERVGTQALLQGEVHGAESISRELFAAALRLAANRDLIEPGREDIRTRRTAWVSEVEEVVDRLRTLEALDRKVLQGVLRGIDC